MSQPYQPPRDPYATADPYSAQPPQPTQPVAPLAPYPPAQPVGYPPAGYGYPPPGYGVTYPEASQATLALIFGLVGIVLFSPLAPFAWWIGGNEKRAIDAGRRTPVNRGTAVAGWVLGIIGTILLGLALLFVIGYIVVIVVILGGAAAGSSWSTGMALPNG